MPAEIRRLLRRLAAALAAACVVLPAARAHAVLCSALPNPVYLTGGGKVVISGLAKTLSASGVTLVYKLQGSCLAVDAILNGTPLVGSAATMNAASYWDAVNELKCDLDPAGNVADLGFSDVFATTCGMLPGGLPADVGDFFGPVQPMVFVVPKASTQKTFSAAAGYFVYGFGAMSGLDPWIDELSIFQRDAVSGTQQMIAQAIGVPAAKWKGTTATSSADMVTKLTVAPAEKAIGILTSEVADANRLTLNVLAYEAAGQSCGYWPDSTPTSEDKQNVRDGHYDIWGPLHLLAKLNANGYPINPHAGDVVGYLTGTKAPPGGLDLISLEASSHTVPPCAMRVKRTTEVGPLMSWAPQQACGCFYDLAVSGKTSCKPCASKLDCPAAEPACNYGYCETQ